MTSSNQHQDYTHSLSVNSLTVAGPIKMAPGVSEWKSFTPVLSTGALGSGGTSYAKYRITGHTLEMKFHHSQSVAGTLGSGSYTIALPTGCVAADSTGAMGSGYLFGASVSTGVIANLTSTTAIGLYIIDQATTTIALWGSGSAASYRLDATGLTITFTASIPLNVTSSILRA